MIDKENFRINKCDDCFRLTRTDVEGDLHTHVKSLSLCNLIIKAVCNGKVPLYFSNRCLVSAQRLSNDNEYIAKINAVLHSRKRKGKKQSYVNRTYKTRE